VHRDNQTVEILDERLGKVGADLIELGFESCEGLALLVKLFVS